MRYSIKPNIDISVYTIIDNISKLPIAVCHSEESSMLVCISLNNENENVKDKLKEFKEIIKEYLSLVNNLDQRLKFAESQLGIKS